MKNIINKKIALLPMLTIALALAFSSCKKDSDGSPDVKPGTPVFESITPNTGAGGVLVTLQGTGLGDMQAVIFEKDSIPAYLMSTLNTETAVMFRVPAGGLLPGGRPGRARWPAGPVRAAVRVSGPIHAGVFHRQDGGGTKDGG